MNDSSRGATEGAIASGAATDDSACRASANSQPELHCYELLTPSVVRMVAPSGRQLIVQYENPSDAPTEEDLRRDFAEEGRPLDFASDRTLVEYTLPSTSRIVSSDTSDLPGTNDPASWNHCSVVQDDADDEDLVWRLEEQASLLDAPDAGPP